MGVSNMFGIKEYKEYYQVGFVEGDDFIDHVAILILDLNDILIRKYEGEFIPAIYQLDTGNDWLKKCWDFDNLSNMKPMKEINSEFLYLNNNDIKIKIVKLDGKFRLRVGWSGQSPNHDTSSVEERDCNLHDLSDYSQRASGGISRIQEGDIFQALKRIYDAYLFIRYEKSLKEYKQLQNNLAFMKKFIRECVGGNNV
jgi:hypothetical protein